MDHVLKYKLIKFLCYNIKFHYIQKLVCEIICCGWLQFEFWSFKYYTIGYIILWGQFNRKFKVNTIV
jgi:hypothetical protein